MVSIDVNDDDKLTLLFKGPLEISYFYYDAHDAAKMSRKKGVRKFSHRIPKNLQSFVMRSDGLKRSLILAIYTRNTILTYQTKMREKEINQQNA